jgi:phosphate transport system protein
MDMGLERISDLLLQMAELSEKSVTTSIDAYLAGKNRTDEIRQWSEDLRKAEDDVSDLTTEVIARYQPVASDLRFIKASMEVSYGFSRLGRYALDIAQVLEMFGGSLSLCDHSIVELTAKTTKEMIHMSIEAFTNRDVDLAKNIPELDDYVDEKYRSNMKTILNYPNQDLKCAVSTTLILRYLERIADHAAYVGESVVFIVTGQRSPRK